MRLRTKRAIAVAFVVLLAVALWASGALGALPTSQGEMEDAFFRLGAWAYALAGGLAFLEVGTPIGLFTPSELGVVVGGAAAANGSVHLLGLIVTVWVCSATGESLSFFVGRRLGRSFLLRHASRLRLTEAKLQRVESHFERHGGPTVLLARFGAYIRTLTPFIAGAAGMPYRRFAAWSITGCALWAIALSVVGYTFYQSLGQLGHLVAIASLTVAVAVLVVLLRRARARRHDQVSLPARTPSVVRKTAEPPRLR